MRTYAPLTPKAADPRRWALPTMLEERSRTHGAKTFLKVPHESFEATFAEMHDQARRVAAGLLARGGEPGDRVLVMAANGRRFVQTWFGCAYAGLVELPINTAYVGDILEHQIRTGTPRFAVIDNDYAARFAASEAARRSVEHVFIADDVEGYDEAAKVLSNAGFGPAPFDGLLEHLPVDPLPAVEPQELAGIVFTSGTTGPSKGVMMPHGQMHFFGECIASATRLTEDDVYMAVGPMFHGNSQVCAIYPAMICGAQAVLRKKFSASEWLAWVREDNVTVTNFIGVMMDFVWRQPPTARDADNALRCIFAIPTVGSIEDGFRERFGVEAFVEGFGCTELSAPVLRPYGEPRPPGAAGLGVTEWYDIRLADPDTGLDVAPGEIGELLVRPKHPHILSTGYFGMGDRTMETWRDLWWHTGDALRRDNDGWYYFVDRLKDALRRRGENISSFEVEQPILRCPGVTECAVIGVPAGIEGGEDDVMAVVVREAASDLTAEKVWSWCDAKVPSFAIPRYVRFVDSMPRTPTEKINKVALRADGITEDSHDRLSLIT